MQNERTEAISVGFEFERWWNLQQTEWRRYRNVIPARSVASPTRQPQTHCMFIGSHGSISQTLCFPPIKCKIIHWDYVNSFHIAGIAGWVTGDEYAATECVMWTLSIHFVGVMQAKTNRICLQVHQTLFLALQRVASMWPDCIRIVDTHSWELLKKKLLCNSDDETTLVANLPFGKCVVVRNVAICLFFFFFFMKETGGERVVWWWHLAQRWTWREKPSQGIREETIHSNSVIRQFPFMLCVHLRMRIRWRKNEKVPI